MNSFSREGDTLPVVKRVITQTRIQLYAEAVGDFNPIHVDPVFASSSQFGTTIAHGMLIAALVSETMSKAFGQNWSNNGRLKLRFRAPVFSGEIVTTYGDIKRIRENAGKREIICVVGANKPDGESAVTGEAVVEIVT